MKRTLILVIGALLSISAFAQDGVKWETGTFQQTLEKAQKSKKGPKMIFVDCYTDWCGPCKYMTNTIFPTKEAGDYFNKNFINIKIDVEKGEGIEFAKKYGIMAYPTFLILDHTGNEIGRVIGSDELDEFIVRVKEAMDVSNSPAALLAVYENTRDVDDAIKYLERVDKLYIESEISNFFEKYYETMGQRERYNRQICKYAIEAINIEKPAFLNRILDDKLLFDSVMGKGAVDEVLGSKLKGELGSYLYGGRVATPETINRVCEVVTYLNDGELTTEFIIKMSKFYAAGDTKAIIDLFENSYGEYSMPSDHYMSFLGWYLKMEDVPDTSKAKLVRRFRRVLDQTIGVVDKYIEQYKEVVVPEEK